MIYNLLKNPIGEISVEEFFGVGAIVNGGSYSSYALVLEQVKGAFFSNTVKFHPNYKGPKTPPVIDIPTDPGGGPDFDPSAFKTKILDISLILNDKEEYLNGNYLITLKDDKGTLYENLLYRPGSKYDFQPHAQIISLAALRELDSEEELISQSRSEKPQVFFIRDVSNRYFKGLQHLSGSLLDGEVSAYEFVVLDSLFAMRTFLENTKRFIDENPDMSQESILAGDMAQYLNTALEIQHFPGHEIIKVDVVKDDESPIGVVPAAVHLATSPVEIFTFKFKLRTTFPA